MISKTFLHHHNPKILNVQDSIFPLVTKDPEKYIPCLQNTLSTCWLLITQTEKVKSTFRCKVQGLGWSLPCQLFERLKATKNGCHLFLSTLSEDPKFTVTSLQVFAKHYESA